MNYISLLCSAIQLYGRSCTPAIVGPLLFIVVDQVVLDVWCLRFEEILLTRESDRWQAIPLPQSTQRVGSSPRNQRESQHTIGQYSNWCTAHSTKVHTGYNFTIRHHRLSTRGWCSHRKRVLGKWAGEFFFAYPFVRFWWKALENLLLGDLADATKHALTFQSPVKLVICSSPGDCVLSEDDSLSWIARTWSGCPFVSSSTRILVVAFLRYKNQQQRHRNKEKKRVNDRLAHNRNRNYSKWWVAPRHQFHTRSLIEWRIIPLNSLMI